MWEQFIILSALSYIKAAVKNPQHAEALKTYLLEIRDTINSLFPNG